MQSRRDVLRGGATLVAAGVLGGLAGCSAITGGGGGSYANWVPEADDYGDRNHLSFTTIRPSDIAANEDAYLAGNLYDLLREDAIDAAVVDLVPAGGILALKRLAGAAAEAGVAVADFHTREASLEDLFLAYTEGDAPGEEREGGSDDDAADAEEVDR